MRINVLNKTELRNRLKPSLLMSFLVCVSSASFAANDGIFNVSKKSILKESQQQITIKGKVTSTEDNLGIPGVNVILKGSKQGVVTDFDGNYSISIPSSDAVLVFSAVGLKTQEIRVGVQNVINVALVSDVSSLDEVIVVGYGTSKKTTLTGSVYQVKGDEVIKGKATTNLGAALQGEIPGLVITRTSSRPGNEGVDFALRGGISVNATPPMILIDGIEAYNYDISQINPNDVETVSVLKDAAAAIYGNRAAGGVILITTKRGKEGKTKVTYSGSTNINMLGKRFPVADGQTYAKMVIDATTNDAFALDPNNPTYNWFLGWSADEWARIAAGERIEGLLGGAGPWRVVDPSSNQFDPVYGNTAGVSHNLSFSGGNDKVKTFTSFGYADDRSLVDIVYDGQKKYNFRSNIDYTVNDWIKSEINTSYESRIVSTPTQGFGQGIQDPYIFPLYNPYGQFYDTFGGNNYLARLVDGGRSNNKFNTFRLGAKISLDLSRITKGLGVNASANIRSGNRLNIQRQTNVRMYDWSGETTSSSGLPDYTLGTGSIRTQTATNPNNLSVRNTIGENFYKVFNAFTTYNRDFSGHNIGINVGVTYEKFRNKDFQLFRSNMLIDELDDINLGLVSTQTNSGGSTENALISYLGRFTYDYKGILLFETDFRRDGSSKFTVENRWANFAGFQAGVRLSEIPSIKRTNIFDNLKIRSTYGQTGSQTGIGDYDYISNISTGSTVFGYTGTVTPTSGLSSSITSSERTWERVATTNLALEFAVLNNRLSGNFEVYNRENIGMLINPIVPVPIGGTMPKLNNGRFLTKGWEVQLNWKDKIDKNFSYKVGVTLEDYKTEITDYDGGVVIAPGLNNTVGANQFILGKPLNAIYAYKTNGYLQTRDEVNAYYTEITRTSGGNHPLQGSVNQLIPGSVRRIDVNNDGRITTDDLVYYGDASPHYLFGFNIALNYKNFDFRMFMQGVGEQYNVRTGALSSPFSSNFTNQNATFYGQTWTPDNPNARYPIMSRVSNIRNVWNYKDINDINLNNSWYARAKSMVLGYTLPKKILNRMGVDNIRMYVSGDNLFEFSNVSDGFDPETRANSNQGNIDVFSRTLSFGIDLTL